MALNRRTSIEGGSIDGGDSTPRSVPQRRSNSTPITSLSLSGRISLLRNALSPLSLSPIKTSASVPSLLLASKDSDLCSLEAFSEMSSNQLQKVESVREFMEDIDGQQQKIQLIPPEFIEPGIELLRITHRKKLKRCFKIDTENKILRWNNKASSFLRIEKIKNIRIGDDAKNYREEFKVSAEHKDLWVTIIYYNDSISNNIKALHVLAARKYEYDMFVRVLQLLVFVNRDLLKNISLGGDDDLFTNFHWNNFVMNENKFNEGIVDTPKTKISQTLNKEGVLRLTKRLNINIANTKLLKLFLLCDVDNNGYLDFEEFKKFVSLLRLRLEINTLFQKLATNDQMSFKQFEYFILEIQHENYDNDLIWKLFDKYSCGADYLSFEDFQNFIKSAYTSALNEETEDFSKPLNQYFVSSSHNTYLLGRQFGGESSVEGYIRVLQRGCRCVEIDIWDGILENGEKGPVVKHGRSFTSAVSLREVLLAIRKYAFISTPFPLILSLEVHCNIESQLVIINLLNEILEGMLVLEPLLTNSMRLPSPEDLKHKILLKIKKTDHLNDSSSLLNSFSSSTSTTTSTSSVSGEDNFPKVVQKKSLIARARGTTKVSPELSALAIYVSSIKFRNFSLPESKVFNHCFSFSEKSVNEMMKDPVKLRAILKHNKKYTMRLYPSKFRINSTNFNPIQYWALGIQMVATNWQMFDLGQQLNEAMFLGGSKSGYVLKPSELRTIYNRSDTPPRATKVKFTIDILSAQQLPVPKQLNDSMNPYIEFEVYGYDSMISKDDINRTKIVRGNGFNPIWEESFEREVISENPSLIFVRLLVKCQTSNDDSVLTGVCVLRLSSLKRGYRHLTIYDLQGEEFIFSKLFVKIDYQQQSI